MFCTFAGLHNFAERARMPAVEGHAEGLAEWGGSGIIDRHPDPGDGLYEGRVAADGDHEKNRDGDMKQPAGHVLGGNVRSCGGGSQAQLK